MPNIHDLPTPALLLDIDVLEANLRAMALRCEALGVRLRPHVKTHKCVEIALAQRALGASGVTVSTLPEARALADAGFDDMTWAFPVIPGRVDEAAELADRVRLGVLVDSLEAVDALAARDGQFRVWLKVDCGYGRAGVDPATAAPRVLAERIGEADLELVGLVSHSGDAYRASSRAHMRRIAELERERIVALAAELESAGFPGLEVSVGSTPSMSACDSLDGVTEVRPGNYALYDYTQVLLGSCGVSDCAATVLASVVSTSPARGTCVVDAGALSMSLDPGPSQLGRRSYGEMLDPQASGGIRRNARLISLSQEHGVLSVALPVGTRLRLVPNHSCLAVACFDAFSVVRGEDVADEWAIHRAR